MIGVVILAAFMSTIGTYIDKHLVNKGITRNDYFYYMCLSMIPFSIIMIVIEIFTGNFKFEFSIIPMILLLLAMFVRYKKQHTVVGCLTHLNPYESVTYMSLGIILAFIVDSILGIKQFSIITLASIVLTLIGVFTLADVKLKIKSLQKDLIIRIVCDVTMGYITHYILKYWSNASFIFILNLLLTILFSKDYTLQYHKKNASILKWVFIQQTFGFCSTYLGNYLSSNSVVLSSYTKPVSIVLTILVAFVIKSNDKKPKLSDVLAVFLVAVRYRIIKHNIINGGIMMKITFIGTGTMSSTQRANTSVLVDDILFDLGMGTIKQIERLKIYTKSIKYICISHYHSDHFLDIPNLLIGRENRNEQTITFIGPIGLRNKVIELMKFTHSDGNEHKYDKIEEKYNIKFVELDKGEKYYGDYFLITAIPMKHGNCNPIYGYIIDKENKKIAYCCDMTAFNGFYKICEEVDYILSDVNGLKTDNMHMGLEDYYKIANKYKKCNFYAIHRGDYKIKYTDLIHFPMDGDVIEI